MNQLLPFLLILFGLFFMCSCVTKKITWKTNLNSKVEVASKPSKKKVKYQLTYEALDTIISICTYKNGKKHGRCFNINISNNRILSYYSYKNGVKHGKAKTFLPSGILSSVKIYKADSLVRRKKVIGVRF